MRVNICRILILFFIPTFCFGQNDTTSQLEIKTYYSIDQMIDKILVGSGMRIGNIKVSGNGNSIGYFSIDSSAIGIKRGLLISTGDVINAIGPNKSPGITSSMETDGDKDLNKIIKGKSLDAVSIEFEFVPYHNKLTFDYCFGSEELREYVGSSFNDGFAFIISGPGLKRKNLATIPGTNTPVSINNVNHKKGIKYYVNNDYWVNVPLKKKVPFEMELYMTWLRKLWLRLTFRNPKNYIKKMKAELLLNKAEISSKEKSKISPLLYSNFEYDGFTTKLKAQCYVKPFKKYKIKIVIGDVGDSAYDSGVFIGEKSFSSSKDTTDPNYRRYKDLSQTMDWDSVFNGKKPIEVKKIKIEPSFPCKIYFGLNEFAIPEKSKKQLDSIAVFLKKNPAKKCQVIGYTDNTGSLSFNEKLARKRAMSVLYYLSKKGVKKDQLISAGKNYEQPISSTILSEEEQALNRRVEIVLIK